ncbi:MAG: glycosyltransferase [Thermoanaerobaculia bacterium]
MRVTFFLANAEGHLNVLRDLDPDRDWRRFQQGEGAWILQTYLRLACERYPVQLSWRPPEEGIVVFHAKEGRRLRHRLRGRDNLILVGVRGDNREPLMADFEIVQNGRYANGRKRFFIPHWPQPGLLPRDPDRGTRIERIAYKGFDANLHPDFRKPEWAEFLAGHGIQWIKDSVRFAGPETEAEALAWPDFRNVDLVLAVRPRERKMRTSKPATKLVNAWLAGVPALLGPEYQFREIRRSDLDYIEVTSAKEAQVAVRRLLADPDLYREMVENGRRRGAEFSVEAILPQWVELLYQTIPDLARQRSLLRDLPLPVRVAARRLGRWATLRPAR